MRGLALGAALAAALLAPGAHAQGLGEARAFVTGLYSGYRQAPEPDYLGREARRVFTPRLLGLIRRDELNAHGEVGALDGDPICDCQDPDGIRLVGLEVTGAGPGRATARAQVRFSGERAETITLDLAGAGGRWRVDDVHTPDTPSLVRLLGGRK